VLQQLHGNEEPSGQIRLSELGERVHLSQSALSRLVSRLEHAGLVERAVCEDDRRSVWTRITDAGSHRFAEARPTQRAILREQLATVPADGAPECGTGATGPVEATPADTQPADADDARGEPAEPTQRTRRSPSARRAAPARRPAPQEAVALRTPRA
jgi:DNA-binding transcriptional ArsR family regulator